MSHIGHQALNHSRNNRMRPLALVVIVLFVMVALHVFAAIFLTKTGSGVVSLSNPVSYIMMGLLFIFALFKLKHLLAFIGRNRRHGKLQTDVSSTGDIPHEQPLP
jgi:hypothetical protein